MEQSTPQREFEFGIETNDLEKIQKLFAVIPRNSQLVKNTKHKTQKLKHKTQNTN